MRSQSSKLKAGEWVEVRGKEEILRTLDADGRLDGMPFMPEMLAFCGKRFQVYKKAHKTCDTVVLGRARRVESTVHLDTRCSGQAHGGWGAMCLLFWKEAWLKPIGINSEPEGSSRSSESVEAGVGLSTSSIEKIIWARTQSPDPVDGVPVYSCQATRLPYASTLLPWWDIRQYVTDYTSGNIGLGRMTKGFAFMGYRRVVNLGIGIGSTLKWLYDRFQRFRGGTPYPHRIGQLPVGAPTPDNRLDLQPGDLVRVKNFEAIRSTCDGSNRNRGLSFDGEMVPYC